MRTPRLVRRFATRGCPPEGTGLCRDDPIPPGIYWVDSIDPRAFDADAAVVEASRRVYLEAIQRAFPGAVEMIRTTHHDATIVPVRAPARDWILFEIKQPIPRWGTDTRWGFPTVAPRGRDTQEGDTVQKPPPEKRGFEFELGGTSIGTYFVAGAVIIGGLVLLKVFR